MSKDHFVAKTYLNQFTDNDDKIIPYYKNKKVVIGKRKNPSEICWEENADINKYLVDSEYLKKYLPKYENRWSQNIKNIILKNVNDRSKFEISGYLSFLRSCTKTANRMGQDRLRDIMEPLKKKVLKEQFEKNPPKDEETREIIAKAIEENSIKIEIDKKFPNAISIGVLNDITQSFYSSKWLILHNQSNRKFITSDNPCIFLENENINEISSIYTPLTPEYAVVIYRDMRLKNRIGKTTEKVGSIEWGIINEEKIEELNIQIIKNAEEMVLYAEVDKELENLVKKYEKWKTVNRTDYINNGEFIISREIAEKNI